ncbi:Piwi-domain-containing protein [Ganoderma leucocontextum]|nr:Piwi-domain-containing protein [Ganoderma leucocontextum]
MYCKRDIPSRQFNVFMNQRKDTPTHCVTITRVATINADAVRLLTQKQSPHDCSDLHAKSLNLLQLIIRQAPNIRHGFPADSRSFYVDENSRDLRLGLSAWRGFFQSVRPTLGHLMINVDVSHALVYNSGSLITVMMHRLGIRDARNLQTLPHQQFRLLRTFLKGVLVSVTVSPHARPRPISDLVLEAGLQEFDKENERCTVQHHFETKYSTTVKFPQYVGVRIGKTAIIPAEFCNVRPGQVFRKKIPPEIQKAFLDFVTQRPDQRFSAITSAVKDGIFNYEDSDYMKDAGMVVSSHPMELKGKIIAPPPIKYGDGKIMHIQPKAGAWNMVGRQFYRPSTLKSWMVVVYDRVDERNVHDFLEKLVRILQRLGMQVPPSMPPIYPGNPSKPKDVLEQYGILVKPELVLCILPQHATEIRQVIKNWGDVKRSVSTQCVRAGKWEKANDQYYNNVALKINSRMGGVNSVINHPGVSTFLQNAMIIGADVGHPGPGINNQPSMTGLVATLDPEASVMTSFSSIQPPRQELIQDLEGMVMRALADYRDWRKSHLPPQHNSPPKHLVFYRDGVSEGELEQVAQNEIPMIKSAFVKIGIPEAMHPKILFIVVGKRHHVRFFAKDSRDQDHSGNCPAGLLVDNSITNPNWEDFYLQSHAGLLGTSRPAHYIVLENEAPLDIKNIQTLTFHLCHQYASATRSVSIPAPVYYADRICGRLAMSCENGADLSDAASENTGATANTFNLEQWRLNFKFQTTKNLRERMPFI